MSRSSSVHTCTSCGAAAARWSGRCAVCGEWNTLVPQQAPQREQPCAPWERADEAAKAPVALREAAGEEAVPFATGLSELDRVLSGGVIAGSVTLLGGEPGIGKSTLVLQAAAAVASRGHRALLVAAEESEGQVARRAARLGALGDDCYVFSTGDLLSAVEAASRLRPSLLVVDSIQTITDPALGTTAGTPNQVRECAQLLARFAKATGTATVLVGHVTKDGALAGPRTLEHLVDTVLSFDGDRHHALRSLVATKHRFGPAGELGLFQMTEEGLRGVPDPSSLLLADRQTDHPGGVALPVVEGRRPLVVEVQALLGESRGPSPRRVVQGVSPSRVALVVAVLERLLHAPLGAADVFVSTVGGVKVTEPAADLAVAVALVSAASGVALADDVVCFGEVGLAGEVRQVRRPDRRLVEAARLGFERAVGPMQTPDGPGVRTLRVSGVREALAAVGLPTRLDAHIGVAPAPPAESTRCSLRPGDMESGKSWHN